MPILPKLFLVAVSIIFAGCSTGVGPRILKQERQGVNVALQQTADEQMLLNLVRAKYRDTNVFLEVSAVASQYVLKNSLAGSGNFANSFSRSIGVDAEVSFEEKPTVSYSPLQGQKFITRMLSRVSPETISLLHGSGWSVERLFLVCVERLNKVKNAPSASGPTPDYVPDFKDFQKFASVLRKLQRDDAIDGQFVKVGDQPGFAIRINNNAKVEHKKEFHDVLGLDEHEYYFFSGNKFNNEPHHIYIETRSLREILFYLSQSIEAPAEHLEEGKVTITKYDDGKIFDWNEVTGRILSIKSKSGLPPSDCYVKICYRDHWFYIEDGDLNSKSTFNLLMQLYNLQSGDNKGSAPVLTLPIGG